MPRGPRAVTIVAALLFAGVLPTQALASGTPSTSSAAAHPWLQLPSAFFLGRQAVSVPRRAIDIAGGEWPYVAGQTVTLQAFLDGHLIKSRKLALRPSARGGFGQYHATIDAPRKGSLEISVSHSATSGLAAFSTRRNVAVLDPNASFGARGRFVALIQQRLAALHFYVAQTGVYDQGTGLAIDAYHRLLRWGTSQTLDSRTVTYLLDGIGRFRVRFPGHGRHAEGNLSLQLLALIDGSRTHAIYPISSGKPSTPTILGDFHVYSKVPGYLPDGMYYSNFFIRGYAIHGYNPAPDYPASHGCMRLPIADATSVYGWLTIGDWVDVYY